MSVIKNNNLKRSVTRRSTNQIPNKNANG